MLEPIQSMAGVNVAPDDYYRELRALCDERGLVLVFDEIQTGLGRTGSWYFGDRIDVVPDIITLAKGAGGGVPVGAVLIRDRVADTISRGEQGSTFGGGPLAAAAVAANIGVIRKEGLVENAERVGTYLKRHLPGARVVKDVKGCGLLIGIELEAGAKPVRDYLLGERGIITGTSAKENVLRLLPPLIMREEHADIVIKALEEFPLS
jgi:acetylornithine aminotransferase/acetylornithine/N-succinyldiaminopimelate aminotransferase